MRIKISSIVGARPQFVKAAMVSKALLNSDIDENIIHTGQHFDKNMSEIFFEEMSIPKPSVNLGIGGGTHGENTGRMIEGIEKILIDQKPDFVLVYGDTDSTLAGALSAAKLHIPIAHVESGLRSFNRKMPEEINRILTDHLSNILFAPSENAVFNLKNEGIKKESIHFVGDIMYDATLHFAALAEKNSDILNQLNIKSKEYMLASIHRAENTNNLERLNAIVSSFKLFEEKIIFPVHPRTKEFLKKFKIKLPRNVIEIKPVGFIDMVMLEKNSMLIATDSGGVQKEAFFHKIPCVTLRDETEWVELVESNWNQLVTPSSASQIAKTYEKSIRSIGSDIYPYGNGDTADLIRNILEKIK